MPEATHLDLTEDCNIPAPSEQDIALYMETVTDRVAQLHALMAINEGSASAVAEKLGLSTSTVVRACAFLRYIPRTWDERDLVFELPLAVNPLATYTLFDLKFVWEDTADHVAVLADLYIGTGMPVNHICAILSIPRATATAFFKKHLSSIRKQGARYKTDAEQRKKILALEGMLRDLSTVLVALTVKYPPAGDTAVETAYEEVTIAQDVEENDLTTPARGFFGSLWGVICGARL